MNKTLLCAKMLENDKSAEDICDACEMSIERIQPQGKRSFSVQAE